MPPGTPSIHKSNGGSILPSIFRPKIIALLFSCLKFFIAFSKVDVYVVDNNLTWVLTRWS